MIEVSTPTLMSVVDGMIRTAISAASNSAAPVSALGIKQARRIVADQRPHQMRGDQTDKADGSADGDRATDPQRNTCDHQQPQPADIDAKALRGFFAKAQRTKSAALADQDDGACDDERQREHDMAEAAVLQRAEQPERDFERGKGIG